MPFITDHRVHYGVAIHGGRHPPRHPRTWLPLRCGPTAKRVKVQVEVTELGMTYSETVEHIVGDSLGSPRTIVGVPNFGASPISGMDKGSLGRGMVGITRGEEGEDL